MKAATPTAPDIESPVDGYELFPFATARLSSPTGDMSITQYSYLFFNEATKMFLKDNETGQLVVEKITVTTVSKEADPSSLSQDQNGVSEEETAATRETIAAASEQGTEPTVERSIAVVRPADDAPVPARLKAFNFGSQDTTPVKFKVPEVVYEASAEEMAAFVDSLVPDVI